jgi:hypothetical protein
MDKKMKTTVSAILGMTMMLAMAGVSFAAQTTPAPAPKAASSVKATATKKTVAKKHSTKAKSAKKVAAAAPAK